MTGLMREARWSRDDGQAMQGLRAVSRNDHAGEGEGVGRLGAEEQ